MLTPGRYYVGGTINLTAAFTDADGTPSDPVTVVLKTTAPWGPIKTYTYGTDANVTKTSTGNYSASIAPDAAGHWAYRWEGTDGAGNTIIIEDRFNVQKSRFQDRDIPFCWDYR